MSANPYGWQFDRPSRQVPRVGLTDTVQKALQRGLAVRLVGGRGTGKSAFLRLLEASLSTQPDTRVVRLPGPPEARTEAAARTQLARALGVAETLDSLEAILDSACPGPDARLVLLLDEADAYMQGGEAGAATGWFAKAWTNRLESQRKEREGRLGIVIAGGLGLFTLAHALGSALVSRAETAIMHPFSLEEVRDLAEPFRTQGRCLDDATLEMLYLLSGGHAALVTYGLEHLWPMEAPGPEAVRDLYATFGAKHADFVRQVWASISQRGTIDAPRRALRVVQTHAGTVPLAALRDACAADPAEHRLDPAEVLRLLEAGGLVTIAGNVTADPVRVQPVASVLTLPDPLPTLSDPLESAAQDVTTLLSYLSRFSLDFSEAQGLLKEKTYSGFLAVGLLQAGWQHVEREAQQRSGQVDVKLSPPSARDGQHIVLEVKKWENPDRKQVQQQVYDYRTTQTLGALVAILAKPADKATAATYARECLAAVETTEQPAPRELLGRWQTLPHDPTDPFRTVHLVVEIPRRRAG